MTQEGRKSLPGNLILAIIAAGVGSGFQHGYNTGVTNAPTDLIRQFINETHTKRDPSGSLSIETVNLIFSTIVSVFAIGGMIGALTCGFVADRIGRKAGLIYNNVLVFIAAACMGLSKSFDSYELLILGRFVIGFNSGLNAGLGPMYLSEISPVHFRGAIGTIYQLIITISILASNVLGSSALLGTQQLWPTLLASTLFGSVVMLLLLPFCPESPNFLLIIQGKDVQAQKALLWLRGSSDVHQEMEDMKHQADQIKRVPKVALGDMWSNPLLRQPLIISLVIMMGQQFSGINAAMFYSTAIFKDAGLDGTKAYVATVIMGVINVSMTFVSLVLIDRAGRKALLMIGFGGMAVTTVLFVVCLNLNSIEAFKFIGVVAVFLFVIMFAIGPGSIPWFLVSELFTVGARGIATSLAVAVNWTANFFVGLLFLPIQVALGNQTFLIFTVILVILLLYTKKNLPETKGRTIEEIQAAMRQRN